MARYNNGRTYPWGETAPSSTLCNYNSNVGATTVVGSYASGNSNLGLCDLSGNIREYVWDWYDSYSATELSDPSGPLSGIVRILRGGCWNYYASPDVRCADRVGNGPFPSSADDYSGFRLAMTK